MPRLAANLSFLFQELPFLERFGAAADAGFRGVECTFPYDTPAPAMAERIERHGLAQVLLNLPPGDWAAGERGLAGERRILDHHHQNRHRQHVGKHCVLELTG